MYCTVPAVPGLVVRVGGPPILCIFYLLMGQLMRDFCTPDKSPGLLNCPNWAKYFWALIPRFWETSGEREREIEREKEREKNRMNQEKSYTHNLEFTEFSSEILHPNELNFVKAFVSLYIRRGERLF